VAVLQAAMPTALVTVVVAKEARAAVDVAVAGVVMSTLLAFVTLPLWLWLLLPLPS
jgi:predicted permease